MEHETNSLLHVSDKLLAAFQIDINKDTIPKMLSAKIKMEMKRHRQKSCLEKVQHGYLFKPCQKVKEFKKSEVDAWLKYSSVSSYVEGYLCYPGRRNQQEATTTQMLERR